MFKKTLFPLLFLILAYFVLSYDSAKEIIAGISIFLVGMFFMEDGFKLFSGGFLEKVLEKFTNTMPKAILNGFIITSVVQSSSLTSVILISFIGASLIALESAIYVLLGSSLGSTTTAWLITLFGLKIKISHYAMPIIAFGIFFRFSKNQKSKGFGNILLGIGFIFLGISYMVNGFNDLKQSVDLAVYSIDGFLGLLLFFIIGAIMTFVVQSSSASITIILAALASGQILYINAIMAIIGGKIGSTATTIIGASTSNANGKRLALAQFILNLVATIFGLILFYPIIDFIDYISLYFAIESNTIKLTIFLTIFNLSAVIIMIPFLPIMVLKIKKQFIPKIKSWERLEFLDSEAMESSKSIVVGLQKENKVLYKKLFIAIKHQLLINSEDIYWRKKNKDMGSPQNANIDKIYKDKIKTLHDEILDFLSIAHKNINEEDSNTYDELKNSTKKMYKLLKSVRNLNKSLEDGIKSKNNIIKDEYKFIKELLIITINELENMLNNRNFDDIDKIYKVKILQQKLSSFDELSSIRVQKLFSEEKIDASISTRVVKDISFAIIICQNLINISTELFVEDRVLLQEDDEDEN